MTTTTKLRAYSQLFLKVEEVEINKEEFTANHEELAGIEEFTFHKKEVVVNKEEVTVNHKGLAGTNEEFPLDKHSNISFMPHVHKSDKSDNFDEENEGENAKELEEEKVENPTTEREKSKNERIDKKIRCERALAALLR